MKRFLKYEPIHLSDDELTHELSIRNIIGLSSKREEVKTLRKMINQESEHYDAVQIHECDPTTEVNKSIRAYAEIQKLHIHACQIKNSEMVEEVRSRTAAWINRLNRIKSENENLIEIRVKFETFYFEKFSSDEGEFTLWSKAGLAKSELTCDDERSVKAQETTVDASNHIQSTGRDSLSAHSNHSSGSFAKGRGRLRNTQNKSLLNLLNCDVDDDKVPKHMPQLESLLDSSIDPKSGMHLAKGNEVGNTPVSQVNLSNRSAYFRNECDENNRQGTAHLKSLYQMPAVKQSSNHQSDYEITSRHNVITSQSCINSNLKPVDSGSSQDTRYNSRPISSVLNHKPNSSEESGNAMGISTPPRYQPCQDNNFVGQGQVLSAMDEIVKRLVTNTDRSGSIYRWEARFSGDGQGYSLNEFIRRVEKFADDERMPRQKLLTNIHRLLDGTAKKWYWASVDEWETWDEFVQNIKLNFLPRHYNYFLREEIENRLQTSNEPFSSFITDMKYLFQKVNPPLDEDYKMYIIQKNMLTEYSLPLATHSVRSLNELIDLCKRIDERRLMIGRRAPSGYFTNVPLVEPSCFPKQKFQNRRNPHNDYVNTVEEVEQEFVPTFRSCCLHKGQSDHSDDVVRNNHQVDVVDHSRPFVKDSFRKLRCFRCEKLGHAHRVCSAPKRFNYCYICGMKNVTVINCPASHPRSRNVSSNGRSNRQHIQVDTELNANRKRNNNPDLSQPSSSGNGKEGDRS